MSSVSEPVTLARQDAPWADCGDPRDPEFGQVFVRPVAGGAVALAFDRPGRRHAVTIFDGASVGDEIVIHGRRFSVMSPVGEAGR